MIVASRSSVSVWLVADARLLCQHVWHMLFVIAASLQSRQLSVHAHQHSLHMLPSCTSMQNKLIRHLCCTACAQSIQLVKYSVAWSIINRLCPSNVLNHTAN